MIRELRKADVNRVAKICFECISKKYTSNIFYQREGFEIQNSGLDEATGEKEYVMVWQ